MAIVQSLGTLQSTPDRRSYVNYASGSIDLPGYCYSGTTYAVMYALQPAVRTCVDFLARNIAQLGYHVFRRVSDTDRERLNDHQLAQWLTAPNPYTTRYRLFESLVADLGIYFNAYWIKVPQSRGNLALVRLPPEQMRVEGGLLPKQFVWTVDGRERVLSTDEVVYFNGYNPLDPIAGLSPLETLRRRLAEEAAADAHRESFWLNASRMEGVIERPKDAPKWTPTQKQSWRDQWQARYAGPQNAGMVAVLEDGMTFKPTSFSARDSEYVASRKLTREEVAAEYHIPLPMVGILDHATFSNIKEQHKQLYADCLGPWLEMIQGTIEAQLLTDCKDTARIYTEFNISEKLKGSFEEQAAALRSLVGRPIMTANEGRARLNLPKITDDESADQLAAQQGGPAATSAALEPTPPPVDEQMPVAAVADLEPLVRATWSRQATQVARYPVDERADRFDVERGARELADDVTALLGRTDAVAYAERVTVETHSLLRDGADAFAASRLVPPLSACVGLARVED